MIVRGQTTIVIADAGISLLRASRLYAGGSPATLAEVVAIARVRNLTVSALLSEVEGRYAP